MISKYRIADLKKLYTGIVVKISGKDAVDNSLTEVFRDLNGYESYIDSNSLFLMMPTLPEKVKYLSYVTMQLIKINSATDREYVTMNEAEISAYTALAVHLYDNRHNSKLFDDRKDDMQKDEFKL